MSTGSTVGGINLTIVRGLLSSPPRERLLPSGDRLITLELTVRRDGERTETIPVAWFAGDSAAPLDTGDVVVVTGRVRRRFYVAAGATRSVTEVVADAVVPASQRARARRAVDRALATLEPVGAA